MVSVISRAGWGARYVIPGNRHVAPSARRFSVVHWPGSNVGADEGAIVRSIERFHRSLGWQAAPGYNFMVGQSGTIFEGCGRDVRGIHSPPRNTDGWGICVMSPLNGQPTQQARNSTRALYDWLSGVAGRQLAMSWHGQHVATACAGPDLNRWVQQGMPATGRPEPDPEEEDAVGVYVPQEVVTPGPWQGTLFLTTPGRAIILGDYNLFRNLVSRGLCLPDVLRVQDFDIFGCYEVVRASGPGVVDLIR